MVSLEGKNGLPLGGTDKTGRNIQDRKCNLLSFSLILN